MLEITPEIIRVWENDPPYAHGAASADIPTLTVYPSHSSGALGKGILVCPGGGYQGLADHEGAGYASWLNSIGYTAVVLKYRLASNGYSYPAIFLDAIRAMQRMRQHADDWGLDPETIGIIGSSAGGHLAALTLTQTETPEEIINAGLKDIPFTPAYGILAYPVISLTDISRHTGSYNSLVGGNKDIDFAHSLSNELRVTEKTPPCFIWHGFNDTVVPVKNSLLFADALTTFNIPYELHIYADAPHGIGLANGHPWTIACAQWLSQL